VRGARDDDDSAADDLSVGGDATVLVLEADVDLSAMHVARGATFALRREGPALSYLAPDSACQQLVSTELDAGAEDDEPAGALLDHLERTVTTNLEASLRHEVALVAAPSQRLDAITESASVEAIDAVAADEVEESPEEGSRPWHEQVRFGSKARTFGSLASLPARNDALRDDAKLAGAHHLASGLLFRDLRTTAVPGTQPVDRTLRRTIARCTNGDSAAAADLTLIMVRYTDDHCDAVVTCSAAELILLMADERPAARGSVVYAATAAEEAPERLDTEFFDRAADEASSSDDDVDFPLPPSVTARRPPKPSVPERRSVTYDIFLHPTGELLEHTLRRLVVRSGGLPFVRRLSYLLRDAAAVSELEGVFSDCVGRDRGHIVIYIAAAPQAVSFAAARPETLSMVSPPPPVTLGRLPNAQAILLADLRRRAPPEVVKNSLVSVPLGGWKAFSHQPPGPYDRPRRGDAPVSIPNVAHRNNALSRRLPPVTQTPYGMRRAIALNRTPSPSLHTASSETTAPQLQLSASNTPMPTETVLPGPAEQQFSAAMDGDVKRAVSATLSTSSFFGPRFEPADVLGDHPRHPGATAEWAYLDILRKRAASSADKAPKNLQRVAQYFQKLPEAPAGHALSVNRLREELRSVSADATSAQYRRTSDPDVEVPTPLEGPVDKKSKLRFRA
jgi:hypothetical protein